MFCPNDKAMLKPVGGVLTCAKCGYQKKTVVGQNVVKAKQVDDIRKSVMEEGDREKGLPTTNEYACEKCGHGAAYYFMRQTRSADEATTRFLECTKCGYKWREYR
ncbi:MAG: transcription factor S [Candidatus Thermoplasmatota archaeon]